VMISWVEVISAVVLFFLGVHIFVCVRAKNTRGNRVPPLPGPLGDAVARHSRTMAYFFSPSCPACRTQTPVIERLRRDNPNIFSIDASTSPDIARALGVLATPTVVIIENGMIEQVLIGARSPNALERALPGSPRV
jgi:thioredoxin 1